MPAVRGQQHPIKLWTVVLETIEPLCIMLYTPTLVFIKAIVIKLYVFDE